MIRGNNFGRKSFRWGVLGKHQKYTNAGYNNMLRLNEAKKTEDLNKYLKPWSGLDKGQLWVMMPEGEGAPEPTPTPLPRPEPITCSDTLSFDGGKGEYHILLDLPEDRGEVYLDFDARGVPDRIQVIYDGNLVADSLFLGTSVFFQFQKDIITGTTSLPYYYYDGAQFVQSGTSAVNFTAADLTDCNDDRGDAPVGNQINVYNDYPSPTDQNCEGKVRVYFNKTSAFVNQCEIIVYGCADGTIWDIEYISCMQPTPTPSATLTPTPTITSSITATPTLTPTSSLTPTPSITTTPSITPTLSPTTTPTPSITPSTTLTPSITPSITPSGGGEFSPSQLTGLKLWFDFSDSSTITTRVDGSNEFVTDITNKATDNITSLEQTTASYQPQLKTSSYLTGATNQVAYFDGVDNFMTTDDNLTGYNFTTYMLFYQENSGDDRQPWFAVMSGTSIEDYWGFDIRPPVTNQRGFQIFSTWSPSDYWYAYYTPYSSNLNLTGFNHIRFKYSGDSTDYFIEPDNGLWINGTEYGSADGSSNRIRDTRSANSNPPQNHPINIGGYSTLTKLSKGEFLEIVMVEGITSSADDTNMRDYFNNKWSLNL